ncbi:MAG: 9-O-acetylesterase [Sphingomonadales bacterium]|nr:MAG: 9-O-acetylesterase [Sphingomonadales bacterium]
MRPAIHAALAALLGLLPAVASAQESAPLLHAMFQDHAVLQRDQPIAVWGDAAPGTHVAISLADKTVSARADASGHWRASLPAMPAGGPYTLSATAPAGTMIARDVLIGDVWLCSGQSNMEFQVRNALNGGAEASDGTDEEMRLLTVGKNVSTGAERQFLAPVEWRLAGPKSVAEFSAACYFMGRDLRRSQKVPIGLINASWGGTAIDAWRSESSFVGDPAARDRLPLLTQYRADPPKAAAAWAEKWTDWWSAKAAGAPQPWQADVPGDWKPVPSFEYWEGWGVEALREFNGVVFYRTEVELTAAQASQGATLLLGPPDDMDMTWVNGTGVGTNTAWGVPRQYKLSPGTLKAGRNRIVVAIYDSWGGGGLTGSPQQRGIRFADGSVAPLPDAKDWQYLVTMPSSGGEPPRAPWDGITGLAGIYNGMIAPIGEYGLRGVAWYQGEADAGATKGYAQRLAAMMKGWRAQFARSDLPFLIVQLANWGPRYPKPGESGFAEIRDEQRKAVAADPHAALVVAVDLGEPNDIHPANKQDVGHRLARAARARVYGSKETTGPWPVSAKRAGAEIEIRFEQVAGQLVAYSAMAPIGFELCGLAPATCRFVFARVDGSSVFVEDSPGPGERIRFCWGDSPVCNLYDESGLPAVPFELKVD